MRLLFIFLLALLSLNAIAVQNIDAIKGGKLIHSTGIISNVTGDFNLTCLHYRHLITQGNFTGATSIKLPAPNSCAEGTRFEIHHKTTGAIPVKNSAGTTLATISGGETYYAYALSGNWQVFPASLSSGGGSFDPSNISSDLIPSTDITRMIGSMTKSFDTMFVKNISNNKRGTNGVFPNQFKNRFVIQTRDALDFTSSTGTMWLRTGYNLGGIDYTGQIAIQTGSAQPTADNTDARSGGITIYTGRATATGTGTSTVGGIAIGTGFGPLTTDENTHSLIQPTEGETSVHGTKNLRLTTTNGQIILSGGSVVVAQSTTYSITPSMCPSGSCTASSPYLISSLGTTPAISNALCTDGSTNLCTAEIVISLQNTSWFGNTATKYVCVQGITWGRSAGQRLRIRVVNDTSNNSTLSQRVSGIIVGFASPRNPISGCSWNTSADARFFLKYQAATSSTMPSEASLVPASQYIGAFSDMVSGLNFYQTGIGSIEFTYTSFANSRWQQL